MVSGVARTERRLIGGPAGPRFASTVAGLIGGAGADHVRGRNRGVRGLGTVVPSAGDRGHCAAVVTATRRVILSNGRHRGTMGDLGSISRIIRPPGMMLSQPVSPWS